MIGALRALAPIALLGACAHAQGYGKFAAGICRVADLDGDGISELAVSDEERRAVWILAPATGEVVRKVEGSGTGGLALPEPDDLVGWQVESFSSSSGDFLSIWGGYLAAGRVPEQKIVDLATGKVVGSLHEGLLGAPSPGIAEGAVLTRCYSPAAEPGLADRGAGPGSHFTFRILVADTLEPCAEVSLWSRHVLDACIPGDLDGDGQADLLLAGTLRTAGKGDAQLALRAFRGTDGARLYERLLCPVLDGYPGVGSAPTVVAIGDLDGDGAGDCAIHTRLPEGSRVLIVSGEEARILRRIEASMQHSLAAIGDVDGDGACDLALANGNLTHGGGRNTIQVHSSATGARLYSVETPFDFMGGSPSTSADDFGYHLRDLGDIDGDGVDDFAASANNPLSNDGEFVAIVSGKSGEILNLILARDYARR